jgi:hypothetical protein
MSLTQSWNLCRASATRALMTAALDGFWQKLVIINTQHPARRTATATAVSRLRRASKPAKS